MYLLTYITKKSHSHFGTAFALIIIKSPYEGMSAFGLVDQSY